MTKRQPHFVVFIVLAGILLYIFLVDVVQTYAGVEFREYENFLAGTTFSLPVLSKYVDVRND